MSIFLILTAFYSCSLDSSELALNKAVSFSFNHSGVVLKIGSDFSVLDTGSLKSDIDETLLDRIPFRENGWGFYIYSLWNGNIFTGIRRRVATQITTPQKEITVQFDGAVFNYDDDFPGLSDGYYFEDRVRINLLLGYDSIKNSALKIQWDENLISPFSGPNFGNKTEILFSRGIPAIEIYLGANEYEAILDTGSLISFIGKDDLKKIEPSAILARVICSFSDLADHEDEFVIISGDIFGRKEYIVFLISDSPNFLTLGLDVLSKQEIAMDFKHQVLYYDKPYENKKNMKVTFPILIYFVRPSDVGFHDVDLAINGSNLKLTNIENISKSGDGEFIVKFLGTESQQQFTKEHPLSIILNNYQSLPSAPHEFIQRGMDFMKSQRTD